MNEGEKNLSEEITMNYILENYQVSGVMDKQDFVTSMDIVRELSEMVLISISEITQLMDKLGFRIEFIEGKPYWVVYLK